MRTRLSVKFNDLAHDCGATRNSHLDHHQSNKCLNRVWANLHARSYLFAGESPHQVLQCFMLSFGQTVFLADLAEINVRTWRSLEQKGYIFLRRKISCPRSHTEDST